MVEVKGSPSITSCMAVREALVQVREQARVEDALRLAQLIAEVGGDGLALLEGVGEEAEHLGVVLRGGDPSLDQSAQRLGVGLDGGDLVVGRRQAGEQAFHLAERGGDGDGLDLALGHGPRKGHVQLPRAGREAGRGERGGAPVQRRPSGPAAHSPSGNEDNPRG